MKINCEVVVVENYKGIAKTCRDAIRKAKAPPPLILARGVRTYKNKFLRYIKNKEKQKENIGLLSNKRGEFSKMLKRFSTHSPPLAFPALFLITKIQVDANTEVLSIKEDLVCEQELDGP